MLLNSSITEKREGFSKTCFAADVLGTFLLHFKPLKEIFSMQRTRQGLSSCRNSQSSCTDKMFPQFTTFPSNEGNGSVGTTARTASLCCAVH